MLNEIDTITGKTLKASGVTKMYKKYHESRHEMKLATSSDEKAHLSICSKLCSIHQHKAIMLNTCTPTKECKHFHKVNSFKIETEMGKLVEKFLQKVLSLSLTKTGDFYIRAVSS